MILAIDQGTTGTTCLVVDDDLGVVRRGYAELPQHFPRPGWVEHDPEEIWQSVLAAATQAGLGGVGHDRDHEPARDDAPVGPSDRPAGRACDRLAGPAHRRALPRARSRADPLAHRARTRSVLLGDEARVAAARTSPPGARLRHGRQLARVEADRGRGARDRHDERLAHVARIARDARLGRRAAGALRRRPRAAAAHRRVDGERGGGRARRRAARGSRDRRRPAGGSLRAGLPRSRGGKGDLRHRQLRARARRQRRERRRRTGC